MSTDDENRFRQNQVNGRASAGVPIDFTEMCQVCDQLIALGQKQSEEGKINVAEHTLREAATLAESLEDSARLTRIVLALPAWHWPGPGEANLLAALLAQRALVTERSDDGRRAILKARLAAELSYSPDLKEHAANLAAAALEQVSVRNDRLTELYVRLYRDQLLRRPDQLIERLANAEEILRLAIQAGDYGACCVAALAKSSSFMTMGNTMAAEHVADFAIGIMQISQVRFHHGLSAAYRAHRAVMDGRFATAEEEFRYCRRLSDVHNLPYLVDACWPAMLMPYGETDRLSEIEILAEDTVHRRRSIPVFCALLSWIKAKSGSPDDASFLLERLGADRFEALSRSAEGMVGMAVLAEVCAVLNRPDYAALLHERILPYAEFNVTLNAVATFGSAERYIGILASVLDRVDEAIARLEKALRVERSRGCRPWALHTGLELASSLTRRGGAEDRTRALSLLVSLEAEAASMGMQRTLSRIIESREVVRVNPVSAQERPKYTRGASSSKSGPRSVDFQTERSDCGSPNEGRVAWFFAKGEYWQVGYEGHTASIRHRKGLVLLSVLLGHPGREFFATELADESEPRWTANTEGMPITHSVQTPILDAEAKRSYRERLKEIRDELEHLREANDLERLAKLEEEQDFLTRELARALGLFGSDRKFGSESERARKRVSIAITRAIRLISSHDQHFGRHLERSIKTGNLCCYSPDPATPVRWRL